MSKSTTSPLSNLSEFSLKRLESVANDSGLNAVKDTSWRCRVSVGSFQRKLKLPSNYEKFLMIIHIGDLIRLSGKTRHGKNRIREHGDLAEVAHIDGVLNALKKFCVIHRHGDSWRWIDLPEDEHMNWEMVEKNDKNHIAELS